jgi:N-hydroxyarylamine O-acetyltransferase
MMCRYAGLGNLCQQDFLATVSDRPSRRRWRIAAELRRLFPGVIYPRTMENLIDLSSYFGRIGYTGPAEPTLAVLRELCIKHLAQIAFENIAPFLRQPVDLDPDTLQAKLVRSRRGGYCQEHNALFHDVLSALGFSVVALGGRVTSAYRGQPAPLTHRLTLVELSEGRFIADVGLGGRSPTAPIRLEPGVEQDTPHGTYRVTREREVFELQVRTRDRWDDMYQFALDPQSHVDFEVANWFTSTHPRSRFTQNLIVCRVVGDTRVNLLNTNLSIRAADGQVEQRVLADADELDKLLNEVMNLALPVSAEMIWAKASKQLPQR